MSTRTEILRLLSDSSFHSGTDLGKKLGITRAAVCKVAAGPLPAPEAHGRRRSATACISSMKRIQPIVIWPGSVTSKVLHLTDVPVTLVK